MNSFNRQITRSPNRQIGSWLTRCLDALVPRCLSLFLLSVLIFPAFSFAQCYEVTRIEMPGDAAFWGNDLNDLGHVVGSIAPCTFCNSDAAIWRGPDEPVWIMPRPKGADGSGGFAINNHDDIAGAIGLGGIGGVVHGYAVIDGTYYELPPGHPGQDAESSAVSINDDGIVAGWRNYVDSPFPRTAFIWSVNSGFTDLKLPRGPQQYAVDINSNGVVAGLMGEGPARTLTGFLWDKGNAIDVGAIPGGISSLPNGINNLDPPELVGSGHLAPGAENRRPFHYRNGVFTLLPVLPGYTTSHGLDINDDGVVIGVGTRDPNQERACIWREHLINDLNNHISQAHGLDLEAAIAINQSGEILALGFDPKIRSGIPLAFLLTPVEKQGDVNCDGIVNVNDLLKLIGAWGPCQEGLWCQEDFDGDRDVDVWDLFVILDNWDFLKPAKSQSGRR